MQPELDVAIIVVALDGRVLDGAVHPLDLTIGPRVVRLGQTVPDPVCLTDHVKTHLPRPRGIPISGLLGELDGPRHCHSDQWRSNGSIGQDRMDPVGHDFHKVLQELPGSLSIRFSDQLNDAKFAGAVNGYEHKGLAFRRLLLGDVDVE